MARVSILTVVLFLSLLLKGGLLYDGYFNGFLPANVDIANPDEFMYLEEGRTLDFLGQGFGFATNWPYLVLNHLVLSVVSDPDKAYLVLCALNIVLSFLSPFVLLPIIRDCFKNQQQSETAVYLFLALTLLWPMGALLATHNLKDTLLQFLVSVYVLLFYSFLKEMEGQDIPKARIWRYFLAATLLILVIFLLRSYLGAILFAISFFPVLSKKPGMAFLGAGVVGAAIVAYPEPFINFVQNNFLFNPDVAKDLIRELYSQGTNARINQDPAGIATGFLRFFLWPIPTTPLNVYQFLEIFQSVVMYGVAYFWFRGIRTVPSNFRRFSLSLFLLIGVFYAIAELFSGPRQRFSSFDHFYLLAVAVGMIGFRATDVAKAVGVGGVVFLVGRYIALSTY